MDIAIINSWLITLEGKKLGIIKNGGVGIEDGKITFVGPMNEFDYASADKIVEASDHITMPGLVNTHFHSGLTLLRGGAQDMPEIEWMNKGVGPFTKHFEENDLIISSKLGVLEGLRTGTTTFAEYTSNVATLVRKVYKPLGVRVVATETIEEVSSERGHLKPTDLYEFDRSKGDAALRRAETLFRDFEDDDLVTCMYGPQALDMISLELLKRIRDRSREKSHRMHMHVAQGRRERLQIQGRYGKDASTVKVLNENDLLGDYVVAAHCHDTSPFERRVMANQAVKMASCQSAIGMIDGIVPPLAHYLQVGGIAGLGTDQAPGPSHHNMFREMRTASMFTKVTHQDPTQLPAWSALQLGTVGGAKVLGLEEEIGTLKKGKQADIITLDLHHLNMSPWVSQPFRNFIPNLVYATTGREVDNVLINGKQIIENNEWVDIDAQKVIAQANESARKVFGQGATAWRNAGSMLVDKTDEGWI